MAVAKIHVQRCLHSGGTKFYTIYAIEGNAGSAVVFNWGKAAPGWNSNAQHGESQSDVFRGNISRAEAVARAKRQAKSARGYSDWEESRAQIETPADFRNYCIKHFGSKEVSALTAVVDARAVELESEPAPKKSKTKPASAKIVEPAATENPDWGTW